MASRFAQQKPDPALPHTIRRARARQPHARDLRTLVVGASLAVTLGAAALVAHADAPAQVATAPVAGAAAPAPLGAGLATALDGLPATLQSWWDAATSDLQSQVALPASFTRTRSSR